MADFTIINTRTNFEELPLGSYTSSNKNPDWNINTNGYSGYDNRINHPVIVDFQNRRCARSLYEAGKFGPSQSGCDFGGGIPNQEEVYLQYDWYYPANWQFTKGNKFPGISAYPTMGAANGQNPLGMGCTIRHQTDNLGRLKWYVYHYNGTSPYGEALGYAGFTMAKDTWYRVITRIVYNTIGLNNGILQLWVNGVLVNTQSAMSFRDETTTSLYLNRSRFTTFMGGSTSDYAPAQTQYSYIDNVIIWKYSDEYLLANPLTPRGFQLFNIGDELYNPLTETSPPTEVPQGTILIGIISTSETTASISYTYSDTDQTGFEYRIDSGGVITVTSFPILLTGLTHSTEYTIEIRAINDIGAGSWSTPSNFTTQTSSVPGEKPFPVTYGLTKTKFKFPV